MTENPQDSVDHPAAETSAEQPPPAPAGETRAPSADEELTGEPELDKRLAEPVLKGTVGIESAQVWMSAFLIVIAGVIAYSNALRSPFNVEDQRVLVDNEPLHSVTHFPQAVQAQPDSPLAVLSYAKIWYVAPNSPAAQRAVNITLHILNAVLLYLLSRRLLRRKAPEPVAMLAGLFLVLHPATTESVNYVVGRAGLLVAFFALASILLFLRSVDNPDRISAGPLGIAAIALALAWASGYAAALVPLVILLVDLSLHGRAVFRRLPTHGLIWGVMAVLVIVTLWGRLPSSVLPDSGVPTGNAARASVVVEGLLLAVNPTALNVDHDIPPVLDTATSDARRIRTTLAASYLAVLGFIGLVLLARRVASGIGLIWVAAALTICAAQTSFANPFSERGMYFALCGVLIVIPWLVSLVLSIPPARAVAGIAATVLLIAAGTGTYVRNRVWQNVAAVWEDAEAKSPESPLSYRQ